MTDGHYYTIEVQSPDGSWSEIDRCRASKFHEYTDLFDSMCAIDDGRKLRLVKVLRDSE